MKRTWNLLGGLVSLAVAGVVLVLLVLIFSARGQPPVAQQPYPVATATVPALSLPATPTLPPYPPPTTPMPPRATPTPPVTVTPPLPVPTLVPIPVPPQILAGEKIAFLRDGNLQLLNVASRALAPATTSGNIAAVFGWSYNSSKLLLGVGQRPTIPESDEPGGMDLWVIDINRNYPLQLTKGLEVLTASWSPVSDRIAYVTRDRGANLFITNSSGDQWQRINTIAAADLAWSADGTKLAFTLMPSTWLQGWADYTDIAVLDLTNRSIVQLTSNASTNFHPVFSLDGETILFESERDYHRTGIPKLWYSMNSDGTNIRHLETPSLLVASNPTRSPVANLVAFNSGDEIWVMDFEGHARKLVRGTDPYWSPDGSKLVYVGTDGGIWLISLDGTGAEKLADTGSWPHWSD